MIDARNRRAAVSLGLGITWACLTAASAAAAPLRPYTSTAQDRRALVLDQEGRRIAIPRSGASLPDGTTPTYLAYRLPARSGVPEGTPTVSSAAGRDAVGPLRLDALAIRSLNAGLSTADQVAVVAPRQAFLVERAAGSGLSNAIDSTQYWRAAIAGQTGGKTVGDTLEGWYNSSTDAVKKFNDSLVDSIKKTFNPAPPKPVILGRPTVAAQVLKLDEIRDSVVAQVVDIPQAAPVPEPSTWIVFAAATGLGVRLRSRKAA